MTMRTRLFVLGCVLMSNQAVFAQTFAAISGETRDASGGVVGGAVVTAVNLGTNASRTVTTNDARANSFLSLPPGTYALKMEKPDFKTVVRNLELQVQQAARLDFEMPVGQVSESIEVQSSATLLATKDATVGT